LGEFPPTRQADDPYAGLGETWIAYVETRLVTSIWKKWSCITSQVIEPLLGGSIHQTLLEEQATQRRSLNRELGDEVVL
jgi:hypothetical protein